ncbi:MAG: DNA polymerase III subunit gamma/tau [candidate division WOR-3 bacterium]
MNLARKYRPKTFSEVVGQEITTRVLRNAISIGKIGKDITAILFSGQRGIGKTTLARIVAKSLNCEKGVSYEPCNVCENCISISEGKNMDVLEIDGASNRGIDEIRILRENVKLVPVKSRYKIIIIDEVHMLTQEAFNALLKTLEEPPPNVVFIFATTEKQRVPDTIISRTLAFDLFPIKKEEILKRLKEIAEKEKINIEEKALERIAENSEGSLRDALTLLEKAYMYNPEKISLKDINEIIGFAPEEIYKEIWSEIIKGNFSSCLSHIKKIFERGISEINFIRGFQEYLNEILKEHVLEGRELPSNLKEIDIIRMIKLLLDAEGYLRWVSNPGIYIEFLISKMCYLPKSLDVEKMLEAVSIRETKEIIIPKEVKEVKIEEKDKWEIFLEKIKEINSAIFLAIKNIKPKIKEKEILIEMNSAIYEMIETKREIVEEKIKEVYGSEMKLNIALKKEEVKKSEIRETMEKLFNLELFGTDESKS